MANFAEMMQRKQDQKEQYKSDKQAERDEVFELRDKGFLNVTKDPAQYMTYLDKQAVVPSYTAGNAILVMEQNSRATDVRSFDSWKSLGRYVNRGENGIKILTADRYSRKQEVEHIDHATGEVFTSSYQEQATGTKIGRVFDITQTHGQAAPPKQALENDSPEMEKALMALIEHSPVDIITGEGETLDRPARLNEEHMQIHAQAEMPDNIAFQSLATEIARAQIQISDYEGVFDPNQRDIAAQSIGYIVSKRFGVEDVTPPDLSGLKKAYKGMELDEIKIRLGLVRDLSKEIGGKVQEVVRPERQQARSTTRPFRSQQR
jgi:hypothetical protein